MSFMVRFRRLFWICANRPPYYDIINGSGLLYVISQCNSGVNLKKLVWPGRGWTFFILLWHGFIPAVPRSLFYAREQFPLWNISLVDYEYKTNITHHTFPCYQGSRYGIRYFRYRAGWLVLFFSVNEYKFLWGSLSVVEFLVGYLIYRFSYAYIYDEWNDYH